MSRLGRSMVTMVNFTATIMQKSCIQINLIDVSNLKEIQRAVAELAVADLGKHVKDAPFLVYMQAK